MTFDSNLLLTVEELTTPRSPTELADWVENKCRIFASHDEAKKWVLLHEGLFKEFYEEVYSLNIFATHLYTGRPDIQCIPNLDKKRDFDAVIIDYSTSPPSELKVEITLALDEEEGHNQSLRMEYFLEHGYVNVLGKPASSGTKKTGRQIQVENEMFDRNDLLKRTLSLIRTAVERKSLSPKKPHRYGQGHVLIVAFDDWGWFEPEQDIPALKKFFEENVLTLPLSFASLYVLGLSGKTLLSFKITHTQYLST
jgi:hypothetical protein